ncbi:MAG: lysophospholipid acyltransferase family protein [Verrucomicrobiales bacterium]
MDSISYYLAKAFLQVLSFLPLKWIARIGRIGGALAWSLDARHRKVAIFNMKRCFGNELSEEQIHELARENFKRIGENYASAAKTWTMSYAEAQKLCEITGLEHLPSFNRSDSPRNCIVAIGHFGNFELPSILAKSVPGLIGASTYRGLRQPGLNRLMQEFREKTGCIFFERRSQANELKAALNKGGLLLGLLSDQNAAKGGTLLPFLGYMCRTNAAPALLSLRYESPLFAAICYRVELGKWRVEVSPQIPTIKNGLPRTKQEIMADVNAVFEQAVRRDPANWFWVHNRWKGAGQPAAEYLQANSSREELDDQAI